MGSSRTSSTACRSTWSHRRSRTPRGATRPCWAATTASGSDDAARAPRTGKLVVRFVVGERHGRQVLYRLHDEHVASLLDEAVFRVHHLDLALSAPRRVAP